MFLRSGLSLGIRFESGVDSNNSLPWRRWSRWMRKQINRIPTECTPYRHRVQVAPDYPSSRRRGGAFRHLPSAVRVSATWSSPGAIFPSSFTRILALLYHGTKFRSVCLRELALLQGGAPFQISAMAGKALNGRERSDEDRPAKRIRVVAACESCRSRKVKCDGKKPGKSNRMVC